MFPVMFSVACATRNDVDVIQAAFQWAVVQRYFSLRLKANQLRQGDVGREKPAAPAGKILFQGVAEARIKTGHSFLIGKALTIWWVGNQHTTFCRGTARQQIGGTEAHQIVEPGMSEVLSGACNGISGNVAAEQLQPFRGHFAPSHRD